MQKLFVVLILLLLLPCCVYASPDNGVFGVKVGDVFALPECDTEAGIADGVNACADMKRASVKAWGSTEIGITVYSGLPDYVKAYTLGVSLLDGNIESIGFATQGRSVQDEVLGVLTKKYGKPEFLQKIPVQNAFNAKYLKYKAHWVLRGFNVDFSGISSDLDWGTVEVTTSKYRKLLKDWKAKKDSGKTKL